MVEAPDDPRRDYEAEVTLTYQTTDADRLTALERSGIYIGALVGELLVTSIDVHREDGEA